jgi:hypothetical protein
MKCEKSSAAGEHALDSGGSIHQLLALDERYQRLLTLQLLESFGNVTGDKNLVAGAHQSLRDSFEKCDVRTDCCD